MRHVCGGTIHRCFLPFSSSSGLLNLPSYEPNPRLWLYASNYPHLPIQYKNAPWYEYALASYIPFSSSLVELKPFPSESFSTRKLIGPNSSLSLSSYEAKLNGCDSTNRGATGHAHTSFPTLKL